MRWPGSYSPHLQRISTGDDVADPTGGQLGPAPPTTRRLRDTQHPLGTASSPVPPASRAATAPVSSHRTHLEPGQGRGPRGGGTGARQHLADTGRR